jgi:hypothetical protein
VRLDEDDPHFIIVDLLIAGYLLKKLIASRLIRPIMLIFGIHSSDLTKG